MNQVSDEGIIMIVFTSKSPAGSSNYPRPWFSVILLICSDLLALIISASFVFEVSRRLGSDINLLFDPYRQMQPSLLVFIGVYALFGLYPAFGFSSVEELRRLSYATTMTYFVLASSTFFIRGGEEFSRGTFLGLLGISLLLVPLFRATVREFFSRRPWWGVSVIILGAGRTGQLIVQQLHKLPNLGFKPIVILDDDKEKHGLNIFGVQVAGALDLVRNYSARDVKWIIIAMPGLHNEQLKNIFNAFTRRFAHTIVVPDTIGISSLWISPLDLGGVLGLEITNNLVIPINKLLKRAFDILVSFIALVILMPLIIFFLIGVYLISKSNPFYFQMREGLLGKKIKVFKIRSMFVDAETRLQAHLSENPAMRKEWEQNFKLKNDPRILPLLGNFIRKFSIDELPQLFNVLKGDMSLVGPRPFPDYHLAAFDTNFRDLRCSVTPGVTGLWQVSSRSDGDLETQKNYDSYYIQNWSLWLDIYILARTVWVVLFGKGAY
jgi:Undecaprenyl-phosphate galactose phosphotransferase WbaP